MKRIKTVNGVKYIQFYNRADFQDRVQEAVTQHRATLINRLLGGLNEYVDYKFNEKVDHDRAEKIKERLLSLRNQAVSIDECEPVVTQLMKTDLYILSTLPYYAEIDESIKGGLAR